MNAVWIGSQPFGRVCLDAGRGRVGGGIAVVVSMGEGLREEECWLAEGVDLVVRVCEYTQQ